jgi:predicted RecB family nuclease
MVHTFQPLGTLPLPPGALSRLRKAGIHTLETLATEDLTKLGLSPAAIQQIEQLLDTLHLRKQSGSSPEATVADKLPGC